MKKLFTLAALALALSAQAQKNLFPASDVDENGWLWFDTQEKIDKYVETISSLTYKMNPDGKTVQIAGANFTLTDEFGDQYYPQSVASPDSIGAGNDEDHTIGGEGSRKGAIVLAASNAMMSNQGGWMVLNLPACATISICSSSEARMLMRTTSTDDIAKTLDNYWLCVYGAQTVFRQWASAGCTIKEGIEKLNNSADHPDFTFVSDKPVVFALQNCHKYPVYIHGIKITVPGEDTGVTAVGTDNAQPAAYYTVGGVQTAAQSKGLYIEKRGNVTRKIIR